MASEPTLEEGFEATHVVLCEPTTEEPVDGSIRHLIIVNTLEDPPQTESFYVLRQPRRAHPSVISLFMRYPQLAPASPTFNSSWKNLTERVNASPPPDIVKHWATGTLNSTHHIDLYTNYHRGIQEGASEEEEAEAIEAIKVDYPNLSRRILNAVRELLSNSPQPGEVSEFEMCHLMRGHSTTQLTLLERKWS